MKGSLQAILVMVGFFLAAQLIGLAIINAYGTSAEPGQETVGFKELPLGIERPRLEGSQAFVTVFIAILLGTGVLYILMTRNLTFLWKIWYGLAVFLGLLFAFGAFIPTIAAAGLAGGLALLKTVRYNFVIHNITELFIYGGLAAMLVPTLSITSAVVLLILISIYDMYAVWKSKHMIALAQYQQKAKLFSGFYFHTNQGAPQRIKGVQPNHSKKNASVSMILGGGDIGFPLLFAGTLFKTNLVLALGSTVGAAIALFLLLHLGTKGKYYPAMPFISCGCFLGLGLFILFV